MSLACLPKSNLSEIGAFCVPGTGLGKVDVGPDVAGRISFIEGNAWSGNKALGPGKEVGCKTRTDWLEEPGGV
jgi:hypothetical protein